MLNIKNLAAVLFHKAILNISDLLIHPLPVIIILAMILTKPHIQELKLANGIKKVSFLNERKLKEIIG